MNKSPINYMGSKRRLLKQLLPLFPSDINTFFDLFAGGGTVTLNTKAHRYVWNDLDKPLLNMFKSLAKITDSELVSLDKQVLKLRDKNYFLQLRTKYNTDKSLTDYQQAVILFLLISGSFNGIPRFNQKSQYNMPWGSEERFKNDSYLKGKIKYLTNYVQWCRKYDVDFKSDSYLDLIKQTDFKANDFLYFDPPYSITTATYNDGKRNMSWDIQDDVALVKVLDTLAQQHIKWGLSNALTSRGKSNEVLKDWLSKHNEYYVYHLSQNYSNSTYHTKPGKTDEIYVTNY